MMGGHSVARNTQAYADVAVTAATLTKKGFLVITGGGPSAMEAAHLGAAVGKPGKELDDALKHMAKGPPDCKGMPVSYSGDPNHPIVVNQEIVADLDAYYASGWDVRKRYPKGGGIAIPTWMYGWEPTTVFAAAVGKYFQNSIREDGLLAAATHGIIYAEGRAGTVQEVFQDAAQNYYRSFPAPAEAGKGCFSPMVFLGDFWTIDDPVGGRKSLPVRPLLDKLWAAGSVDASKLVHYVTAPDEAVAAIELFQGPTVSRAIAIAAATSSARP